MIQKRLFFLAFFVLFFSPLSLFSFSYDHNLSNHRYWQQLLHFKNGQSEIDSKNFFLSNNGKFDASSELNATLEAILSDNEAIVCRYPARILWLYKKIPALESEVSYKSCKELDSLIKKEKPSFVKLVFPTAHINSPASMFGHSFLRVDSTKEAILASSAINYAAKTAESNGFIFAYQGLTGGYQGRYSILPYYKKIKEYNHLERRDIWEFDLNLNKEEIIKLLYHLYELRNSYADYFFFTENCSYNLLWLLEIAREDTYLVDKFSYKAIPIDTLRAVKDAGFIDGEKFRPSKTREIKAILEKFKDEDSVLDSINKDDFSQISDDEKPYAYDLSIALLQLKRTQGKIEKRAYITRLMNLLKQRSKLPKVPKPKVKEPVNPLFGHKSERVSFQVNSNGDIELSYKPAFHDIYDLEHGFISGSYIDFFVLSLQKKDGESLRLKKFDLVNITSYAIRDKIFKPISWAISVGIDRFRDELNFKLRGDVGFSYGWSDYLFFMGIMPTLYIKDDVVSGVGPKLVMLKNFSTSKFGLSASENFYDDGESERNIELFSTFKLSKSFALNIKYDIDKIEDIKDEHLSASLFYYF
jgi:hypothetical protein